MPLVALPRQFARRMLPAALAAGLTLALLPPLVFLAERGLGEQATIYARHFAAAVQAVAWEQPQLWRYEVHKVLQATAGHQRQQDIGTVRVLDCRGVEVFSSRELQVGTGRASGPRGEAPVIVHGQLLARVEVVMDAREVRDRALKVGGVSLALGLALALFLVLYPTRVVRGQAGLLGEAMARLQGAERGLIEANRSLAGQVAAAVTEVQTLSRRVVAVQEEERARIARDLHDGVGQILTALRLDLELAARTPARPELLRRAGQLAEEALVEVRRAVADLRPGELQRLGLVPALRALAEAFEARTGVATAFRVLDERPGELPGEVAQALFRILQEALTNVSRHSRASQVGIVLQLRAGQVRLQIADDGQGFAVDPPPTPSGLVGIVERARLLGGRAEFASAPGEGVRIEVCLPWPGSGPGAAGPGDDDSGGTPPTA